MPHSDTTADAFMARILQNPADPLPRLVFADWLEETGTSSNMAWARYLRLADEIANTLATDARQPKLEQSLERIAGSIQARLTFRAETLLAYPNELLQLLPARNLIVNAETVVLPRSLAELIPESVVRESRILLMGILRNNSYLIAASEPTNRLLADRIRFILNKLPVFVGLKESGLGLCIDRNYDSSSIETVECVMHRWLADDGLRHGPLVETNDPATQFCNLLLLETFEYPQVTALEFTVEGSQLTVWHWFGGTLRQQREYATTQEIVRQLVPLLRSSMQNPEIDSDGITRGEIIVAYWGHLRTLRVQMTNQANGQTVIIAMPREPASPPIAALNPAA